MTNPIEKMSAGFRKDISGFLERLKQDSAKYDGYEPFETLMKGLSDGSIEFKWAFGGRVVPHREPVVKNYVWLRYLLSAPFLYAMIIPTLILDISVSIFQNVCFRLWRVPLVSRRKHLVLDRHKLGYLSFLEKINCIYCGYTNGVYSYAKAVAGETERYWCPVKHQDDIPAPHQFYLEFADYNDPYEWEDLLSERTRKIRSP